MAFVDSRVRCVFQVKLDRFAGPPLCRRLRPPTVAPKGGFGWLGGHLSSQDVTGCSKSGGLKVFVMGFQNLIVFGSNIAMGKYKKGLTRAYRRSTLPLGRDKSSLPI